MLPGIALFGGAQAPKQTRCFLLHHAFGPHLVPAWPHVGLQLGDPEKSRESSAWSSKLVASS